MAELAIVLLIVVFVWMFSLQEKISSLQFQLQQLQKDNTITPKPGAIPSSIPVEVYNPQKVTPVVVKQENTTVQSMQKDSFSVFKLFSWIGGFALLLGIIFLAKYSLEHNLISPALRITIGVLFGIILWTIGALLKNIEQKTTAHTLLGCGISVFYVSILCAYHLYQMLPLYCAIILLGATSIFSFVTAIWKNAKYISLLAQLIGFLSPFLLVATDNSFLCLSYLFFITLATVATAIYKDWKNQLFIALIFSTISQLVLFGINSFHHITSTVMFAFAISFYLLFSIVAYCRHKGSLLLGVTIAELFIQFSIHTAPQTQVEYLILSLLVCLFPMLLTTLDKKQLGTQNCAWIAVCLAALIGYGTIDGEWHSIFVGRGTLAYLFACVYGGITFWVYKWDLITEKIQRVRLALLASLTTLLTTIATTLQFNHQWLTVALALEGFLCIIIHKKLDVFPLNWCGKILLSSVGIRLLINPLILDYYSYTQKFFNWYLYTYGICALSMLGAAYNWKQNGQDYPDKYLQFMGGATLFWLLNIQIANFFTNGHIQILLSSHVINQYAVAATYTIAWLLVGIVCVVLNARTKKLSYILGLVLIGISLSKLFLFDIWILELAIRIIVLISVAIILIVFPFLYQKYKHLLQ